MLRLRSLLVGLSLVIVPLLAGCSDDVSTNEDDNPRLPSSETSQEPITASVKVGSTVKTTTVTTLRNGSTPDTKALRVIPRGAKVTLLKAEPQNNYYRVKHDGLFGWVFGKHLDLSTVIAEPVDETTEENPT